MAWCHRAFLLGSSGDADNQAVAEIGKLEIAFGQEVVAKQEEQVSHGVISWNSVIGSLCLLASFLVSFVAS